MSHNSWAVGSTIAGYRLMCDAGQDAYGGIFLGCNDVGRQVVVRTLSEPLAADQKTLIEFYQQAKLGMSVEHPGVLGTLEVGEIAGRHFAVTEFLGAENLKSRIKRLGRFDEQEAVRLIHTLAGTLQALHERRLQPVAHRALAPANVLINADGLPILSGLQWASPLQNPSAFPSQGVSAELFQYLAPEQIRERGLALPSADVYSLGALLYTLVTGKIPFKGRDARETVRKKLSHDFRSPETLAPGLSRSVVQIIRECLRADPNRRPASMLRLRDFLDCTNRVVGGYRLKAYLGSGNTGDVYQAVSARGQHVALKLLPPKIANDPNRLMRFYRGAKVSIQVSHPHLLEGLEVDCDAGQHFLATELVNGENLMWLVQKHGPLPESHALNISMEVAAALQHVHEHQLVHRDVKPSNVLIEPNGHVKLADLGFAKCISPDVNDYDLTTDGRALGTCQYMPPEQFTSAKRVDHRGDLYSLGVTLYVLLTGKVPFQPAGAGALETLMDKATNAFRPVREINPKVSEATSQLVGWAMQADPAARPPSADSFARAARECLRRLAISAESNGSTDSETETQPPGLVREEEASVLADSLPPVVVEQRDGRSRKSAKTSRPKASPAQESLRSQVVRNVSRGLGLGLCFLTAAILATWLLSH